MRQTPSRLKRIASHWNRKVWARNEGKWEEIFDRIDNPYLKIKVASVMLWDATHQDVKEGRDFTLLKSFADNWRPIIEQGYREEELVDALMDFGYPMDKAIERSKEPLKHHGRKVV